MRVVCNNKCGKRCAIGCLIRGKAYYCYDCDLRFCTLEVVVVAITNKTICRNAGGGDL